MRTVLFERVEYTGVFKAVNYRPQPVYEWEGEGDVPRLCASATSRIFKLGPGAEMVKAVFLKSKPRCQRKHYEIRNIGTHYSLKGFSGSFMGGVPAALRDMYIKGYRYVRVERVQ